MSKIIPDLMYTESHEWVRQDGDFATIGITDFAQAELGDVVYVSLPELGRSLKKGDVFGAVESVKTASDLYSPVSGEVVEVNESLSAQTELVNSDPYGAGYLLKIRLSDTSSTGSLLNADAYASIVG